MIEEKTTTARTGCASRAGAYRRPSPDAGAPQRTGLNAVAGDDDRMRENVRRAPRVIDKDIQIMIHGETGTGKETCARAIQSEMRGDCSIAA